MMPKKEWDKQQMSKEDRGEKRRSINSHELQNLTKIINNE